MADYCLTHYSSCFIDRATSKYGRVDNHIPKCHVDGARQRAHPETWFVEMHVYRTSIAPNPFKNVPDSRDFGVQ